MPESWTTLLEPLNELEVSPDLRARVEARRRHEVVADDDMRRRHVRWLALAGAAGLAAVVLVVVMVIAAHSRRDRPTPAHSPPDRTKSPFGYRSPQTVGFGEPVLLDGMTFVAKELVEVRSVPIPNGQPLKAAHGMKLWMLTVSVRNDGQTPASEPFCHGRTRYGELMTRSAEADGGVVWYHGWSRDSLLIDSNHQLCNDIPPGSTETFQLLFHVPNGQGKMHGVLLQHRSSPEVDHSSDAFVAFEAR
jgi:hypothetical protein